MHRPYRHPLISGARVTSLGTLVSRVLGMVRDMATASLLGLAGGGVMDAFALAYRLPNLFRRLLGEGALTASYLPVVAGQLETDPPRAWKLASVLLTWLSVVLAAVVLVAELVLAGVWLAWGDAPGVRLLVELAAIMMPYTLLVCLAAQLTTTLHALSHFTLPALVPAILNVCWLAAAWLVAPWLAADRQSQAMVLAASVVVAGVLQVGVQIPLLRRLGFRFDHDWAASRQAIGRIAAALLPMLLGLAVTQLNTLCDSLIAWGLAAAPDGPAAIPWLAGAVRYPLRQGAAAAVYYGERFYQFPVGVLGLAVAAAIFPLLSRHAARGDRLRLGADLTLGLRLVVCLSVPAAVGLIMLAEPVTRLLLEHGRFTAGDTARAARMIACYAAGVPAFCAMPVLVRGFYALGEHRTPARLAAGVVGLNLSLNLALIWTPLAEAGLAVATSVSALVQGIALLAIFSQRRGTILWPALAATAARSVLATLVMAAAGCAVLWSIEPMPGWQNELVRVLLPLAASAATYCLAYRLAGGRELAVLAGGRMAPEGDFDGGL